MHPLPSRAPGPTLRAYPRARRAHAADALANRRDAFTLWRHRLRCTADAHAVRGHWHANAPDWRTSPGYSCVSRRHGVAIPTDGRAPASGLRTHAGNSRASPGHSRMTRGRWRYPAGAGCASARPLRIRAAHWPDPGGALRTLPRHRQGGRGPRPAHVGTRCTPWRHWRVHAGTGWTLRQPRRAHARAGWTLRRHWRALSGPGCAERKHRRARAGARSFHRIR